METVSAAQFASDYQLPDWRFILGGVEATFVFDSFGAGARFVVECADAADAADHHPDMSLRYPGTVHIALNTHSTGGVTSLDTDLAAEYSRLAQIRGASAEPLMASTSEVAIDATDIDAIRPFWAAVLGYVEQRDTATVLVDPRGRGPTFWFQQMDEPRAERNNIHIDVAVPHDVAEQRVAAAIAAGGRLVSDARAKAFWILADPEGNEACICTWQDR